MIPAVHARPFRWDLVPRLARAEVAVRRALAGHLGRFSARVEADRLIGGAITLETRAVSVWPAAEVGERLGEVQLVSARLDDVPVLVAFDRSMALDLVGRVLGYRHEGPLPRALSGSEDAVLTHLVAHAARSAGIALVVGTTPTIGDPWAVVATVHASWPGGHGTIRVVVAERIVQRLPPLEEPPLPDVLVRLPVTSGRARLTVAQIEGLRVGDVVVFFDAQTRVSAGTLHARASRDGARLRLETLFGKEAMTSDVMDHAEVEITVQIGRAVVPVRELAALQPGSVLELDRPIAGPVDLHVGDRRIARGEIVDVEGRLGVRIRELG